MLIPRQKPLQFCIPLLKTPQPVMPYYVVSAKKDWNSTFLSVEGTF
jgi:hypothetical protein